MKISKKEQALYNEFEKASLEILKHSAKKLGTKYNTREHTIKVGKKSFYLVYRSSNLFDREFLGKDYLHKNMFEPLKGTMEFEYKNKKTKLVVKYIYQNSKEIKVTIEKVITLT